MKKQNKFVCMFCDSKFKGKPYAVLRQSNMTEPIKICSLKCWKDFLPFELALSKDLYHDEMLFSDYSIEKVKQIRKRRG